MEFMKKLLSCIFCWKVDASKDEEIRRSDVVIALSFGLGKNGMGMSNLQLAFAAEDVCDRYNIPVIAQWEIADSHLLTDTYKAGVVREHRVEGKYLDTREVLEQAAAICAKEGWKKAIIVAHPDHLWRCAEAAKKFGFEVAIADTSCVVYDEGSVQSWTRSRSKFVPREIAARLLYLCKGWI